MILIKLDISHFLFTIKFNKVFGTIETQTNLVYAFRNFLDEIGMACRKNIYDWQNRNTNNSYVFQLTQTVENQPETKTLNNQPNSTYVPLAEIKKNRIGEKTGKMKMREK